MNDKLAVTGASRFLTKKTGIAAKLENAAAAKKDISKFPNRLGIVFDDSGSMGSGSIKATKTPIELAHDAIDAFVKSCNAFDTALALYPLNAASKVLTDFLADIAIYGMSLQATGGTPLYTKLTEMLESESITRAIAFSDGDPTDTYNKGVCISSYNNKKVSIDTIYIGEAGGGAAMKELAEATGGVFLHFTDASVLAKSFKYLTPGYRALLMNPEVKAKIERGEM